ncbi:hypothetical protein ACFZC3_00960 [Streptomyces sp. NPDC007903]|uniref:hypothetical protein n=1 Tax=Streptomyces sp. NPDC007903 TaxID=3364786 RepID=UPI0036ECFBB1
MGIRMLHRLRPAPRYGSTERTDTGAAPEASGMAVPVVAAGASAARHPANPLTRVRRAGTVTRRALAAGAHRLPDWRAWADLARGYLALLLTHLPKARPRHTLTVFVASLTDRPAPATPRRPPHPVTPGPRPGRKRA